MKNRYNSRRAYGYGCGCNGCYNCQNNCKPLPKMPTNPMLANAYVPYQEVQELFCPLEALENGTTFPELVSPYSKNQSQEIINYLRMTKTCGECDSNEM